MGKKKPTRMASARPKRAGRNGNVPPAKHQFTHENQPPSERKVNKRHLWRQIFEENVSDADIKLAITKLRAHVRKGNMKAIQDLLDRVLGKATQPIAGDEENPLIPNTIEILEYGVGEGDR
jgi:hypothetical protein